MSRQLISRSDDLRRLREEGYEVEVRAGFLLMEHVPYVDSKREVRYGTLVSSLTLAGDVTARPDTHAVMFGGEAPCDRHGDVLSQIVIGSATQQLAEGVKIDHTFSSKPPQGYADYYEKMTTYVNILSGPAQAINETATAQTHRLVESTDTDSVFRYADTASSRAGIIAATEKLRVAKVAIVGLGGTGSYILDLIAKVPIEEIHLFDGDSFLQHNAFRAPGAASMEHLRTLPSKAEYFKQRYENMRRNVIAHEKDIGPSNVEELSEMDFVFLALDDGTARRLVVDRLETWGKSFIDVGMGIYKNDESLGGQLRVTTSTPAQRPQDARLPTGSADAEDQYRQNIQIADLNALNAALAVIKWKKLMGFYVDLEAEHFSIYEIDGNGILNEDKD